MIYSTRIYTCFCPHRFGLSNLDLIGEMGYISGNKTQVAIGIPVRPVKSG